MVATVTLLTVWARGGEAEFRVGGEVPIDGVKGFLRPWRSLVGGMRCSLSAPRLGRRREPTAPAWLVRPVWIGPHPTAAGSFSSGRPVPRIGCGLASGPLCPRPGCAGSSGGPLTTNRRETITVNAVGVVAATSSLFGNPSKALVEARGNLITGACVLNRMLVRWYGNLPSCHLPPLAAARAESGWPVRP